MRSPAPRHVVAVDLGTSRLKVALVSEQGEVAAAATRPVATALLPDGGAEQDPEAIWAALRDAVREVIGRAALPPESIAAVAPASQFCSLVPVDAEGRATSNLLLWLDGRGGRYAADVRRRHPDAMARWIEVHGIPPLRSGQDALSKILWLQNERPREWQRTHSVLEPADWLVMRLTGRFTASPCTAFMLLLTGTEHPEILEWHPDLVRMSGVDPAKLPPLVPPCTEVGRLRREVAEDLGLPPAALVYSGTNDTQAASIATATFRPGAGAVNAGTTGQMLCHLPSRRLDLANSLVSMPSPLAGRHLLMAENGIAARALDHFLRDVVFTGDALAPQTNVDPFAGLEETVAAAPPGSRRLLFLPSLTGTGAPDGNARARGAFVNISLGVDRACMVRAILEGVAFSLRGLLEPVEALAEATFGELRFSGGGARSDAWSQIVADVFDRPVLPLADPLHSNNRASALLAFEQLGLAGLDDIERFCPVRHRFEPRREHRPLYDELYGRYRAAYEGLCPVFDALNDPRDGSQPGELGV